MRTRAARRARGAVYLEAAVAVPVFLLVVLFAFDSCYALFRYAALTKVTAELAREFSTDLGLFMEATRSAPSCPAVRAEAQKLLPTFVARRAAFLSGEMSFAIGPFVDTDYAPYPFPTMKLTGTFARDRCLFCHLWRWKAPVSVRTIALETLVRECE